MPSISSRLLPGLSLVCAAFSASAQDAQTPDGLVKQLSAEVMEAVKSDKSIQAGDTTRVMQLVDSKVMPLVNAERMTASAVGRHWRQSFAQEVSASGIDGLIAKLTERNKAATGK
jgi:phospholipid transport system substrate-binding protein